MPSQLFRLNLNDAQKAILMAFLAPILLALANLLTALGSGQAVTLPDWHLLLKMSLSSGGAYLLKNFLSDPNGRVLGKIG